MGPPVSLDFSSKIPKPLLEDIDGPVTFSSDGKEFAFMRRSEDKRATYESILVAEANNIHKNESLIERPIIVRTMAWSPASDKIAAVIYNAALLGSMKPHLVLIARDGTEEEVFSSARFRSMDSPVWMAGDAMLLFAAATQGRTNQQAKLYEVSLSTKQVHEIPAPPFSFETVSATSDGQLISAVRQTHRFNICNSS